MTVIAVFAVFAAAAIIAVIAIIALFVQSLHGSNPGQHVPGLLFEPEERRYGRYGEQIAGNVINRILREDDALFTNVSVSYDGKKAELDNVVVNKYGVFIIEVKNYKGRLYGNEEDYDWQKIKDDEYGNSFEKTVRNPIKQVARQTYILSKYLNYYGASVWVEGYALLIHKNSPVESDRVLNSEEEIDAAVHTYGKTRPDAKTVEKIKSLLS